MQLKKDISLSPLRKAYGLPPWAFAICAENAEDLCYDLCKRLFFRDAQKPADY
jgi:hypothetical protein